MSLRREYETWHAGIHEDGPEHEDASDPWYQLVREYVSEVAGLRILEVACGRGRFVRELARRGARVIGCDFSFTALRAANEKLRAESSPLAAALIQGDAQSLPFAAESFDLVVSCETIEHLPDARAALREMYRVTRPGGRLLLTTPNYANFMGLYELYSKVKRAQRKGGQPFDRRQCFPQIRKGVQSAGWKIVRTDGTVHQVPVWPRRSPMRIQVLEANPRMRKLLSPFALHYFVMGQKK